MAGWYSNYWTSESRCISPIFYQAVLTVAGTNDDDHNDSWTMDDDRQGMLKMDYNGHWQHLLTQRMSRLGIAS